MRVTRDSLKKAVDARIINQKEASALYDFLSKQDADSATFNFTHVLYYLGGMIAIGAMTLFMQLGWETFGGFGILTLAVLYAILGLALTAYFDRQGLIIPAGICATFVICLTPLAIYGFQVGMGWWTDQLGYRYYHAYIDWRWIFMEAGTLICGAILAYLYRYPFMLMPIAVTLWYISMDLASMVTGGAFNFQLSAQVSLYFGLFMILLAFYIDIRSRKTLDYAFWLYLFGVITFWGGLSSLHSDSELNRFIYCLINLLLIGVGVILYRRVFIVFGALGLAFYLGHLANVLFKDSVLFPVVLSAIGFLIIYLGVLWQKNENKLTTKLRLYLPQPVKELLESRENKRD